MNIFKKPITSQPLPPPPHRPTGMNSHYSHLRWQNLATATIQARFFHGLLAAHANEINNKTIAVTNCQHDANHAFNFYGGILLRNFNAC